MVVGNSKGKSAKRVESFTASHVIGIQTANWRLNFVIATV